MNTKVKFLLILLGVISLSAVGLSAWIYFSSQTEVVEATQKRAELEKQNTSLQKRLEDIGEEIRRWREKAQSVTAALNKLGKEHTLLQSQYTSLFQEKDSLSNKNKELSEEIQKLQELYSQEKNRPRVREKQEATDEFLSSLLEEKASLQVEIERLKKRISAQEAQFEQAKKLILPVEEEITYLKKEKQDLESKLQNLETKLEDARKVSDVLSSDLLQEKRGRATAEKNLAESENRLQGLMRERDELSGQLAKMKQALEERLVQLNETEKVLQSAVEGAEKVMRRKETASIQLPPIVVKAEPILEPAPKLESVEKAEAKDEPSEIIGNVIAANDEHNFVVIDIGTTAGVEKGMSFSVFRQGKKIARVEVIELRANIAACDIKEAAVKRLKVNDTVRR